MKLGSSLLQKGLFLVFVPLTFQLAVLGGLAYLQAQAEEVAARAEHAAKIDEAVNHLIKGLLDNLPIWEWSSDDSLSPTYWAVKSDLLANLKHLKVLIKDHPGQLATVDEVEEYAHEALQIMETHKAASVGAVDSQGDKEKKHRFRFLKQSLSDLVSNKLLPFASEERQIIRKSPELQAQNRANVRALLLAAVVFNILLAVTLVVFYNRDTVRRLSIIFDNSMLLASRKPLHPPVEGSDEIARLDTIFHAMAESLAEAAHKESLVIENAQDLICSFDAKGSFITINPAAKKLLDYLPEELIGRRISSIIIEEERDAVQVNLKLLMNGKSLAPFETRLLRKDGKTTDTLWSAHWSPVENQMFCVIHDVTERKQAERLRQEVVQMVSHDLRTPLTTIQGILEIVSSGKVGELTERGKKMILMAHHSSVLMLSLARDLLEIEKMEAGMLELSKTEVKVSDVFKKSIDAIGLIGQQRKVSIYATPTDATVLADSERLVQILVNLLTNAIKFSPPDSTVTLSTETNEQFVEIRVSDQGRGIPPSMMTTIFERFKQVRESDSKVQGGTGLGLAICKALVELHGGDISVVSQEGAGSTFAFRIPNIPSP